MSVITDGFGGNSSLLITEGLGYTITMVYPISSHQQISQWKPQVIIIQFKYEVQVEPLTLLETIRQKILNYLIEKLICA